MRHTKIIATVGPATSSDEGIRSLTAAGVDIFRLNFSHGTQESHAEVVARIRTAADTAGRTIGILQDLGGPKIRIGALRDGFIDLVPGDELTIAAGDFVGDRTRVSTTYAELPRAVRRGDILLLDDGHIEMRVEETNGRELRMSVIDGGRLGQHKGINAPGVILPAAGLTAKDAADLKFGVKLGVDFVALSFVHDANDVKLARAALTTEGAGHIPIIAKLERPEAATTHLDEILAVSNAVMVARGDLGLEMPLERVPRVQKEITRKARAVGIPVIVATQVLESMRSEPRPTRAEVSDAANSVDDGVDAIMLAGETAVGEHPIAAVQTLDAVINDAENIPPVGRIVLEETDIMTGHGRALCEAAVTLADRAQATAIVAVTRGGKTARLLSALRPLAPIYAATDQSAMARRLVLQWGVVPILADLGGDVDTATARIADMLVERGAVSTGAVLCVVSINPDLTRGNANFLKLQRT